jgi:biopolymer transport protein ExbD
MRNNKLLVLPDLTPLADVAWLLLIFLLMTTKSMHKDPHFIDIPESSAGPTCTLGQSWNVRILVDADGGVCLRFPQQMKPAILRQLIHQTPHRLSPKRCSAFLLQEDIGYAPGNLSIDSHLPQLEGRNSITSNEMIGEWVDICKKVVPKVKIALIGDQNAPYPTIEKIFSALQTRGVNRFSLLIRLEHEVVGG